MNTVQASQRGKPRIALMTYAIDGRRAKGTAIVARKSVEALLKRRDEFDLTFIHYEKSDDPIYSHGVREVIFPSFTIPFLNFRSLRQIYYFVTTKDLYDIAHWFQPRVYPFFWLVPAKRIVATLHGAGDLTPDNRILLSRFVFNWTLKLFNKRIHAAIAGSEFAKKDIVEKYGFSSERVHVVEGGAESYFEPATEEAIAAVKRKYELPDFFFLNVARLEYTKNAFRTMRAFEKFAREVRESDIHFVNVGNKGLEKPQVADFLQKSPLKHRIHLVGYVEEKDLPAMYSAAYALVFPLMNEGFGLPALEAMACKTPVVISETAFPEIQRDEAILVDALSEDSIAKAMRQLVEHPEIRNGLIERGYAKAKTLTWEETGRKVIAIYKKLLQEI